jgi:hypothetical protein
VAPLNEIKINNGSEKVLTMRVNRKYIKIILVGWDIGWLLLLLY